MAAGQGALAGLLHVWGVFAGRRALAPSTRCVLPRQCVPAPFTQVRVGLPEPPTGHKWCRVVDTNLASPKDFTPGGNAGRSGQQQLGQADRQMLLIGGAKGMPTQ